MKALRARGAESGVDSMAANVVSLKKGMSQEKTYPKKSSCFPLAGHRTSVRRRMTLSNANFKLATAG